MRPTPCVDSRARHSSGVRSRRWGWSSAWPWPGGVSMPAPRSAVTDERRHGRVRRVFLQVGQVVRGHAGAAGRLSAAEPVSAAFDCDASSDVAGVRCARLRCGIGRWLCLAPVGAGRAVIGMADMRVGAGEHERHLVRVRPAHVVRGCPVLVVQSDYLAVAPCGAGGGAFDDELVAEVSSHGRRPSSQWCCLQRAMRGTPPLESIGPGRGPPYGSTGPCSTAVRGGVHRLHGMRNCKISQLPRCYRSCACQIR